MVDKLLKIPSDSISDSVIFQNFLGGMPPDPPRCLCILHTRIPASPTSTVLIDLVVPPLFKSLDPPLQGYKWKVQN